MTNNQGIALLMIARCKKRGMKLEEILQFYQESKTFLFFRKECIGLLKEMIAEKNKRQMEKQNASELCNK